MAMPQPGHVWPPNGMKEVYAVQEVWDAWYSGDVDGLIRLYGGKRSALAADATPKPATGILGRLKRAWYGSPRQDSLDSAVQRHVPIASDICQASADMLFSDLPKLSLPDGADQAMQDRLAVLTDEDSAVMQVLPQAAELAAALGGTFLRVTWDDARGVFLSVVDADGVVPTFSFGKLTEALVWSELARRGNTVTRFVERHFTDAFGIGFIEYAVFVSSNPNELGQRADMAQFPELAGFLANQPEGWDGVTSTESPGLALVYVPNILPQRSWRKHATARHLGRSDLDGVESLMDALDETMSEWVAEIHRTRSRIIASETVSTDLGPGRGTSFDLDRTVFTPLPTTPGALGAQAGGRLPIEAIQFSFDAAKYRDTCAELVEQIIRSAGFSQATFGIGQDGAAQTATEVSARQQRTMLTRDRKIRLWRPALSEAVGKILDVDAALFGGPGRGAFGVDVAFPDAVQPTLSDLATTAAALRAAEAASTETLVQLIHPDWTPDQVSKELARLAESAAPDMTDPADPSIFPEA